MIAKGADCPYLSEQSSTPPSDGLDSDDGGGFDITGFRFGMLRAIGCSGLMEQE